MVEILEAVSNEDLDDVRGLFGEYVAALGVDLEFQGFSDELEGLPGRYGPPGGRLRLARVDAVTVGCAALRKLDVETCELKRLFVRPSCRRHGVGRALCNVIFADARQIGYRRIRLDTLIEMEEANVLYRALGFREIAPYCHNPLPGAKFFEMDLD